MPLWGRYCYTLKGYLLYPFCIFYYTFCLWSEEVKCLAQGGKTWVCLITKHMLSKTPWCFPTETTICRQYLKSWKLIGHRKWYSLREDKRSQKRNSKEVNISKVNWGSWHANGLTEWPEQFLKVRSMLSQKLG